uniref:Polyprotein protein n=1 Tax=Solanum tuberosum TaxID=4113 RepID=M1E113_SOLTU
MPKTKARKRGTVVSELCQCGRVPRDTSRDIEVTSSSSTDIRFIEAEYKREEVDRRRVTPVDILPEIDVDSLPAEASFPTPTSRDLEQTGESIRSNSFESRSSRSEEGRRLSKVYRLQFIIGVADDEHTPETLVIPPATTGEVQRDGTTYEKSDVETEEEKIVVHDDEMKKSQEESILKNLPYLVEMIVQPVIQISPTETPTAAPSGSDTTIPSEVTPDTKAQVQIDTPGTEALTDGVTA